MELAEDKSGRTRTVLFAIGLGFIALAIAYVLAPGPLVWLGNNGYISAATGKRLLPLFYPLTVLSNHLPPLKQFYEWWMSVWWEE